MSFSEIDTDFSNNFEILSFNIQFIIIYYWALREPDILGNGHIFFAGIVNDIIMGLPLGMSALTYLIICFVASYIRTVTVKMTLFTDWFTFAIAIFFFPRSHLHIGIMMFVLLASDIVIFLSGERTSFFILTFSVTVDEIVIFF